MSTIQIFSIRAYGKTQFAQLYENEACYNTIMLWLKYTIKKFPLLFNRDDYNPKGHILNSYQIIAFIIHHGAPEGYYLDENDKRVITITKMMDSSAIRLIPQNQENFRKISQNLTKAL